MKTEKNYYKLNPETLDVVNFAASEIRKVNNEAYLHVVFHVEELSPEQDTDRLHIIEVGKMIAPISLNGGDHSRFINTLYFLVKRDIDTETLTWNLSKTLWEIQEANYSKPWVCYSFSVLNSRINSADIYNYLLEHFDFGSEEVKTQFIFDENTRTFSIFNIETTELKK
jgi:hypothetical protein